VTWVAAEGLRLAETSVFLDFDGTVTRVDTCEHLLTRLGRPGWQEPDELYASGAIGSRECLVLQWSHLPADEQLLRSVAREVPVDPVFAPLAGWLREAGAELAVVSDGFGFRAAEVCAEVGIDVLTNEVDWATGELRFPNADRCCPCSSCGTCKQAPIRDARRRGRSTVFAGDGVSDRKAALLADVVFAKGHLAAWCEDVGVDHLPFSSLADLRAGLGRIAR
jgi:2-hydroxy-3-keto-5-methylthiopentenyl-1-phosphate phosphatase